MPAKRYFTEFQWNKSKYPFTSTIPALLDIMDNKFNSVENDLRKMTTTYNETRTQLTQNTQKEYLCGKVGGTTTSKISMTSSSNLTPRIKILPIPNSSPL
jgi:flagellar biosynthesis chaperone FliJ